MTDRELLEAAARAAHLPAFWDKLSGAMRVVEDGARWYLWRPLHDDGDALRLAVALRMSIDTALKQSLAMALNGKDCVEPHGFDPYAATRRAIVRAAAAIRALPPHG